MSAAFSDKVAIIVLVFAPTAARLQHLLSLVKQLTSAIGKESDKFHMGVIGWCSNYNYWLDIEDLLSDCSRLLFVEKFGENVGKAALINVAMEKIVRSAFGVLRGNNTLLSGFFTI